MGVYDEVCSSGLETFQRKTKMCGVIWKTEGGSCLEAPNELEKFVWKDRSAWQVQGAGFLRYNVLLIAGWQVIFFSVLWNMREFFHVVIYNWVRFHPPVGHCKLCSVLLVRDHILREDLPRQES